MNTSNKRGPAIDTNGHKPTQHTQNRTMILRIEETENEEADKDLLRNILEALLDYPGSDRVHLDIHTQGRRVRLDMALNVSICADLQSKLEPMLGENRITITSPTLNNGANKLNGQYAAVV